MNQTHPTDDPIAPSYLGWYRESTESYINNAGTAVADIDLPYKPTQQPGILEFRSGTLSDTFYMLVTSYDTYYNLSTYDSGSFGNNGSWNQFPDWLNGTVLECRLWNSTYDAHFHYENGVQNIASISHLPANESYFVPAMPLMGPGLDDTDQHVVPSHCQYPEHAGSKWYECIMERKALRQLSYQAIMDAFFGLSQAPSNMTASARTRIPAFYLQSSVEYPNSKGS